jgi:hypothetical protein
VNDKVPSSYIASIVDYAVARETLSRELRRKFMFDTFLFLVVSALAALAFAFAPGIDGNLRSRLLVAIPTLLLAFGIISSGAQCAHLGRKARDRLCQMEARTAAGEAVSHDEFMKPVAVRLPWWLRWS